MKGSEDECLVAVRSLEMSVLKCAEASGSLRGGSAHFRSFPGCQWWFCTFQKASLGASGVSAHFRKLPPSSKRFIDVEEEARLPAFSHTVVEADVDVLLKFPAIADAPVGQDVAQTQRTEFGKHRSGSDPCHESVAAVDMLPQFGLRLELVVVAIPPAVVAAHGVRVAQESHVVPLERTELQHADSLQGQR